MDSEMKWRHVFAHRLPSSKTLALTGQNIYIQFICTEKNEFNIADLISEKRSFDRRL
jgi:hypothetical protein